MPTMMRNAKNTGTTGGRSAGGTLLSPGNRPSGSCVRISEPAFGIEISKRFISAFSSGQANSTSAPGLLPSQCASIAAILIGWCSSVLSPCWSPMKSCSGPSTASMPIAMRIMVRPSSPWRPARR